MIETVPDKADPLEQSKQEVNVCKSRISHARDAIKRFADQEKLPIETILLGENLVSVQVTVGMPERSADWPVQALALRRELYDAEQRLFAALSRWAGLKDEQEQQLCHK